MGQGSITWYYGWGIGLALVSAVCLTMLGIVCFRLRIFRRHRLFFKVLFSAAVLAGLSFAAALLFLLPGLTARAEEKPVETVLLGRDGEVLETESAPKGGGFLQTVFSKEPVTAQLIFREKNFDRTSVAVTVGDGTGRETVLQFGTEGWTGTEGLGTDVMEAGAWEEKEGCCTAELRFLKEGDYRIHKISCGDLSGNRAVLERAARIVIDREAPELSIELPEGDNPFHPGYYSSQAVVWLYLKEQYFREGQAPEVSVQREAGTGEHNTEEQGTVLPGIGGAGPEAEGEKGTAADEIPGGWQAAAERGLDWYKYPVTLKEDGRCRLSVSYQDPSGNGFPEHTETEVLLTVDTTPPDQGSITALGTEWKSFWEKISFNLYASEYVPVCLKGADRTSPVEPLRYYCSEKELTKEELDAISERQWKTGESLCLAENTRTIVYLKVVNFAGLWSYFSSEGIVVENKGPLIALAIRGTPGEESGFYLGDVAVQVELKENRERGVVSGLSSAGYYLTEADGRIAESGSFPGLPDYASLEAAPEEWRTSLAFPAEAYHGRSMKLTVWAEDRAGNRTEKTEGFTIDRTAPEISVRFRETDAVNGRYYNKGRTAEVTIREPNFSEQGTELMITNTEGKAPEIGRWSHEGQVHRIQISFAEDGDYRFSVRCRDRAGNVAESSQESFVIDRTPPELSVEFEKTESGENGAEAGFYPAARRAVLTVRERNFTGEGLAVSDCRVGTFVSHGDTHSAEMLFQREGDYKVRLDYTDLAGNSLPEKFETAFIIDTKNPRLTVTGIADGSANRGEIEALISCQDSYLKKNSFMVSLFRLEAGQWKKTGENPMLSDRKGSETEASVRLSPEGFPKEEAADGLYLIRASCLDRAGNKTDRTLRFSVNRFGSVYRADEETAAWLYPFDGSYPYLGEEKEVILLEYNVDEVMQYRLIVSREGGMRELLEGTDFERTEAALPEGNGGRQYQYRIKKEVFSEEGDYELVLYSGDQAGNRMGNTTAKAEERKAVFAFSVDKTGPMAFLSGGESGEWYYGREKRLYLVLWDNMEIAKVETEINGEKQVYEGEALEEAAEKGRIGITLSARNSWQTVKVRAWDRAGNPLEEMLSGGGGTETEGESPCLEWNFFVTDSWWMRLFNHPAYQYVRAVVIGLLVGGSVVLLSRRRRKKEN